MSRIVTRLARLTGLGAGAGGLDGLAAPVPGGVGVARARGRLPRAVLHVVVTTLLLAAPLLTPVHADTVPSEEETTEPGDPAQPVPPTTPEPLPSAPDATAAPQPTEQEPAPNQPAEPTAQPSEGGDQGAPGGAATSPVPPAGGGEGSSEDPGEQGSSGAGGDAAPLASTEALSSVAQAWADEVGVGRVRQHTGEQGDVAVGQVLPVTTWAPGFLDGSEPQAPPVSTQAWAAPVEAENEPVGLLVVEVDDDSASVVGDDLVLDSALAQDVAGIGASLLVRDQEVGAWYSVESSGAMMVSALGDVASKLLAGRISLAEYGEVLRERSGAEPVVSAEPSAQPAPGGWTVWGPVLAVVTLGAVVVGVTVHHERRITAPLRRARTTIPLGADTVPDSHVSLPRV